MLEWIAPIVVLALAGFFLWLSEIRKKKVHKFSDPYCIAFMEICDHIMQGKDYSPGILYETTGKDSARMLPFDKQSPEIQELLSTKPDEYCLERFRKMHELRQDGQMLLTGNTLIGEKYNGVFNRLFSLADVLLSTMYDIDCLQSKDQLIDLNFVLLKQEKLRTVTLPAIMSKEGKALLKKA
ncbi:MAG: hypothetical protein PHT58_07680 [Eubacteriales bacterium]|nr:hypothetical protein [Eubacteriales bacterium]